jgi:hypothetical protein
MNCNGYIPGNNGTEWKETSNEILLFFSGYMLLMMSLCYFDCK